MLGAVFSVESAPRLCKYHSPSEVNSRLGKVGSVKFAARTRLCADNKIIGELERTPSWQTFQLWDFGNTGERC
jgi:hypothetical protein